MPLRDGEQLIVDPLGLVVPSCQREAFLLDDQGLAQVLLLLQVAMDGRGLVCELLCRGTVESVKPIPTHILQHPGEKLGRSNHSRDSQCGPMSSPRGFGLSGIA